MHSEPATETATSIWPSCFSFRQKKRRKNGKKTTPQILKLAPNGTQSYVDNFSFKPTKVQTSYTTSLGDVVGAGGWRLAAWSWELEAADAEQTPDTVEIHTQHR